MTASPQPVVADLAKVTVEYGSKVPVRALDAVSLRIMAGDYLAVVGRSGSGKSTLLALLGALRRPTAGVVTLAGRRAPTSQQMTALRRTVLGYVFQDFQLLRHLSALENVALGGRYVHSSRVARRQRAEELLADLGLEERAGHVPAQMSGGEKQRVAIARALMRDPALILADEPTGSLDEETGSVVLAALEQRRRPDTALVVVTHADDVAARADRRVRLVDGSIEPGR